VLGNRIAASDNQLISRKHDSLFVLDTGALLVSMLGYSQCIKGWQFSVGYTNFRIKLHKRPDQCIINYKVGILYAGYIHDTRAGIGRRLQ